MNHSIFSCCWQTPYNLVLITYDIHHMTSHTLYEIIEWIIVQQSCKLWSVLIIITIIFYCFANWRHATKLYGAFKSLAALLFWTINEMCKHSSRWTNIFLIICYWIYCILAHDSFTITHVLWITISIFSYETTLLFMNFPWQRKPWWSIWFRLNEYFLSQATSQESRHSFTSFKFFININHIVNDISNAHMICNMSNKL